MATKLPPGRPKGRLDVKPRAARGSKMRAGWGDWVSVYTGAGSKTAAATIETTFREFDTQADIKFAKIVHLWSQKVFTPAIQSAVRNSMWIRRGMLSKTTAKIVKTTEPSESVRQFTVGAVFQGAEPGAAFAQEQGRAEGGAPKGKYYLVPLATWIEKHGKKGAGGEGGSRPYMTKAEIRRDLAKPDTFMPKHEFKTKAGPARIIFLYHKGRKRWKKDKRGRFMKLDRRDALGRKMKRSKLSEIATAMYLAYKGTTGIYGASRYDTKQARASRSPLAAQFGLTQTTTAPKWWSRGAANALTVLFYAIKNVKSKQEAFGQIAGGGGFGGLGAVDDEGELIAPDIADSGSLDIFDRILEGLTAQQLIDREET